MKETKKQSEQPAIVPILEFRGVTKLAKELGVSQTHLSLVLRGKRKPGPELTRKIAELGIQIRNFARRPC